MAYLSTDVEQLEIRLFNLDEFQESYLCHS